MTQSITNQWSEGGNSYLLIQLVFLSLAGLVAGFRLAHLNRSTVSLNLYSFFLMNHQIILISLLAFLLTFGNAIVCFSQQTTKRDLSRYQQGGTYDFSWGLGPTALEEMRPKLRKFLWENWSQRRLATTVAVFYTIEGDPTKRIFYIEPDKNGNWQIVVDFESFCCALYSLEKPKRKPKLTTGKEIYQLVERLQMKNGSANWSVIPDNEISEPEIFLLRLKKSAKQEESDIALMF